MNEFDNFDKEIAALFREERRKESVHHESIQPELAEVVEAFYGHVAAFESLEQDWTVEEITQGVKPSLDLEELAGAVSELLRQDVERIDRHDDLLIGEVHVSGSGDYMYFQEDGDERGDDTFAVGEALQPGEYIIGEIDRGSIAPLPESDTLTLALHIKEATLYDAAGSKVALFEEGVIIRIDNSFLSVKKVRYNTPTGLAREQDTFKRPDAGIFLKGSFLQEICNDIENNLNRNDYPPEEHFQVRAEEQAQLSAIIESQIGQDAQFLLSAHNAVLLDGTFLESLERQTATYNGSTIIEYQGSWRIVHGFDIYEGETKRVIHVLPEDIETIS